MLAARREQLARHTDGLPRVTAESNRQLLIRHLAQAIPASEAGAEVSLALAGVAADSLSQMIPGLLGGNQAQNLLSSQRQRMIQQIEADLDNTLLYVYRELSDAELEVRTVRPVRGWQGLLPRPRCACVRAWRWHERRRAGAAAGYLTAASDYFRRSRRKSK